MMKVLVLRMLTTIIAILALLFPGETRSATVEAEPHSSFVPTLGPEFGKLPLAFVPNVGQTDPAVQFQAHGLSGNVFFTPSEVVLAPDGAKSRPSHPEASAEPIGQASPAIVRLRFEGANPAVEMIRENKMPGIANYFVGNNPAQWHTNAPTYAGIVYKDIYPCIDLRYNGAAGYLKGSYIVSPGANPDLICWRYEGTGNVRVDEMGNLQMDSSSLAGEEAEALAQGKANVLTELAPIAWQDIRDGRVQVAVRYIVSDGGSVRFVVGKYDPARPLIIDPTLVYSTYLGGSGNDSGRGITVDVEGNVYVVGITGSTNFPIANPLQKAFGGTTSDVFVAKLNGAGTALVYSTYLGGTGPDEGHSIAVDSAGNAHITGSTWSNNFPTANPLQANLILGANDAFVAKLSPTGSSLIYSTYLGGSGQDEGDGIAVDGAGNAYVTGYTSSKDFPMANALQTSLGGAGDAFVANLNGAGTTLVYSTYLGGSGSDAGRAIAVDGEGNAYVTGQTYSSNFPTANPMQASLGGSADIFVAKLNPMDNALIYSTYLGGSELDIAGGIAVDGEGNTYITGSASSTGGTPPNFPIVGPLQGAYGGGVDDAFVAKLNTAGNALVYSTYLGGSGLDSGYGIAVDKAENVYVAGLTSSTNFPLANAIQAFYGGGDGDAFVAELNASGRMLVFSTFLGGSASDSASDVAVDDAGNAYITGVTGSTNFPMANPLQPASAGGADAFVAKISPETQARAVDAKVEVVWPHDEQGRERPVSEAPLANVLVYLFERGTLNPVSCSFPNTVELQWAFNLVGKDGASATQSPAHQGPGTAVQSVIGRREMREVGGKRFPVWVFNDVPVYFVQARDAFDPARSKMFFTVRVDGVDFRTNVWAHGTDPLTYLPQHTVPSVIMHPTLDVADPLIQVVWPHDANGDARPVSEASLVNVGVDIFEHPLSPSIRNTVRFGFDKPVRLLRSMNDGFLEPLKTADQVITMTNPSKILPISWPRWVFNDVDVSAAQNPANKYFFAVQIDGVETHTTIWSHGANARTIFPQIEVPARSANGCS